MEGNKKWKKKKLAEVLERMEKKQDTLLESMSVILNYLLVEIVQKEPKDEKEKEQILFSIQVLLIFRDKCMESVHGEEYTKHMDELNKETVGDILKDILENILK